MDEPDHYFIASTQAQALGLNELSGQTAIIHQYPGVTQVTANASQILGLIVSFNSMF